ncbi:MAG: LuxR C-terminal-related transcriptional regulator, partial [Gammaproteobacteria bacterium]
EWLQGRDHVAWYRATSASADLAAFSAGLADVIAPIVPGTGNRLKQRLRVGDAPERAVRPLAELLAEDLAAWPEDGIIVVDDYHLVTDSVPVEDFVDWVLTLVPVRMLITTRRRPAWALARRVLYGEIMEIGPEQLAMNDEEASRVLEGRPSESVRMLVRQAHGWPALIGLAALSATLELPEERVSDALFRYFAEEVLRREPADVQRFMLLASVPPSLNARIAKDVLGFSDPEPLIQRLRSEDILRESERDRFTFHPLVRDFLRRRLEIDDAQLLGEISTASIHDAASEGRWEEALDLVPFLERRELAADLAAKAAPDLLAAGRIETLEKWLTACDVHVFSAPGAALARAEVLTRKGRLSEAASVAQELARVLGDDGEQLSKAWYVAGRALHLLSDDEASLKCHRAARDAALTPTDVENALWGCFVAAAELELSEASHFLDALERGTTPSIDARLRLGNGRVLAAERQTSYASLAPSIDALVPLAGQAADPMITTSFLARAADLNISRGRYETARQLAQQAIDLSTRLHLEFATILCWLSRLHAEIGLRQDRSLRRGLLELNELKAENEDPYVDLALQSIHLRRALMDGRPLKEEHLLVPPSPDLQKSGQGSFWSLLGISYMLSNRFQEAEECIAKTLELTQAVEPVFYARYGAIILSLIQGHDSRGVLPALRDLIMDTQYHEVLDALVVAYRAYPPLLTLAAEAPDVTPIVSLAVAQARDEVLAERAGLRIPQILSRQNPLDLLTPREREVLALLGQGLMNAEIAKALFISQSTAKVHLHHIFEKLNVSTRMQAVLKAQELLGDDRD